jgi:hypothetical protein
MFNQKVNGYISENPDYVNFSYGSPEINPVSIHRCGTTIDKYTKTKNCSSLPLQSWCEPNVAVNSFGMRPIVNPKEYFGYITKYFSSIIYTDSISLKNSRLPSEQYSLYDNHGNEPDSSFLQAIQLEVSDTLSYFMDASVDQVTIFKEYNPICEGFVITDITITTYQSQSNPNHFFHRVLFSAFNTTRYNTISLRAELYQDTTPMMDQWNKAIKDFSSSSNGSTIIYISFIGLVNNTVCVTGQESECEFKGYNLNSSFSQLLNENFLKPPRGIMWEQPDAITQNSYNIHGNYDQDGNIQIIDYGPDNLDTLIKRMKTA